METELTSGAVLRWATRRVAVRHYIEPGKPVQNAFIESFNSKLQRRVPQRVRVHQLPGEARADHRGDGGTTTNHLRPHSRVSATWRRRSSRQGIKGARPARGTTWPAQMLAAAGARRASLGSKTRRIFSRYRPQRVKGGRKNWYEHETTTTNDTPQEGRK